MVPRDSWALDKEQSLSPVFWQVSLRVEPGGQTAPSSTFDLKQWSGNNWEATESPGG